MNTGLRHPALVGAAMIGGLVSKGYMEAPVKIDMDKVYAELRADGGVRLGREDAITWALGIMEKSGGLDPGGDGDEDMVRALLDPQYDVLVEQVGKAA